MSFDFKVGDLITTEVWKKRNILPVLITAIGQTQFLGKKENEEECVYFFNTDWQLYKPEAKTVKMAPALFKKYPEETAVLSKYLFKNKEDAEATYGSDLIMFPAKSDENGFYDVPVEGE